MVDTHQNFHGPSSILAVWGVEMGETFTEIKCFHYERSAIQFSI